MDLPQALTMTNPPHNVGRRGDYYVKRRDMQGLGVLDAVSRSSWSDAAVHVWTHAAMPNRYFGFYDELRAAARAVPDHVAAAELAKYPRLARMLHAPHGNGALCDVCGAPAAAAAFLSMSWRHQDDRYVKTCDAHAGLMDRPVELLKNQK